MADIMAMLQPLQSIPAAVDNVLKDVSAIGQHVQMDEQEELLASSGPCSAAGDDGEYYGIGPELDCQQYECAFPDELNELCSGLEFTFEELRLLEGIDPLKDR
eukprot:2848861-Lingulodinium_polyedra.AAC.1